MCCGGGADGEEEGAATDAQRAKKELRLMRERDEGAAADVQAEVCDPDGAFAKATEEGLTLELSTSLAGFKGVRESADFMTPFTGKRTRVSVL